MGQRQQTNNFNRRIDAHAVVRIHNTKHTVEAAAATTTLVAAKSTVHN